MSNIIKSASKIVLLTVTFTISAVIIYGAVTKQVDFKELTVAFIALLSATSGFYFANKGEVGQEYLGK